MCSKSRILMYGVLVFALALGLFPATGTADDSLLVWYQFEGNADDSSDYGNNGVETGTPSYATSVPGQGQAIDLDGTADAVDVDYANIVTGNMSIALWMMPRNMPYTTGYRSIFHQDTWGGGDIHGHLRSGTSLFNFDINGGGGVTSTTAALSDEWYHVALTIDAGATILYVNGVAENTASGATSAHFGPVSIGSWNGTERYFDGLMDDFRVYDRVLTEAEIQPLAMQFGASNPSPADGSNASPQYALPNVYMLLDYTPEPSATTHTAYFSDVEQNVIDRLEAFSLGDTPPWPAVSDTAFVVGYDDEAIVEYARAPLVAGTTYYWCVDATDGIDNWPGNVWSFTVLPPYAWGPDPADGAELVSTDLTLSWNLGDLVTTGYSVRYMIYVGTDEAAVEAIATGNTTAPEYMGTVQPTSFDITGLDPETEIFWRIDTKRQQSLPPFPTFYEKGEVWSFTTMRAGFGGVLREVWTGITGVLIPDLTNDPDYPDNPDTSEIIYGLFEGPTDVMDNYGTRLHGWLSPLQTGDYTFWIATDDAGELWLSTDASPDNASLIAYVTGWVPSRNFDGTAGVPGPGQMSAAIHLEAGNMYYISGLMKEGGGGDNIAVAWECLDNGLARDVIPGYVLMPYAPVFAESPDPANNSVDIARNVTLSWTAGRDPGTGSYYTTQHVYVGSDQSAVANATTVSPEYKGGPSGPNEYGPLSLGYYEDVYWRIDGVVASSGEVEYPGAVWTFRTIINPAWASNPNPNDGATGVDGNVALSWTPGAGATAHTVYFGADDPANMVQVAGPSTSTTYNPPGSLDLGTTYYWRVVESPGGGEGLTWQFTTSNYLVVDDMESYTPWTTPLNNIFEIWLDGFGDCAGSGNDTGAVLTENADPVLGGVQSMKYEFDNDETVFSPCDSAQVGGRLMYSKIEVQTSDLVSGIGSDWTIGGVKALRVPFYGQAGNATTESLWVQLQDGAKGYGDKVFYGAYEGESLDDFNEASWHDWYIDLADFDVDLGNVVSITLGIGKVGTEGETAFGSGTLYFDEIRLYASSCRPDRAKPAADFDNSCKVDYPDIAAMFDVWLLQDLEETVWGGGAWTSTDIGDSNVPGSFTDHGGGAYTITGGGHDIWDAADDFHYAYKPLSGDGQMTVRVTDIGGPSTNDWRKAGIMIRETLDQDSAHAFMAITPAGGGGSSFQWRSTLDGDNNNQDGPAGVTMPQCIRLLRVGDQFRAFRYVNGEWAQAGGPVTVPMAEDVLIGLAVTSHNVATMCTATFDRVCSEDFIAIDLVEDSVINFEDYAELMNQWMDEVFWP